MDRKLLSGILCLVSVLWALFGCSANESPPIEPSNVAPPHQLIFFSQDELAAFLAAPNLSDDELERFLKDNSYSMNGVTSRETLDAVLQAITGKPFPVVKNATLASATVHVETNNIYARYEAETGEVYSFDYSLLENIQDQKDAMSYEEVKIIDSFSVNADEPFTASKIRHDFKNVTEVYFIETSDTVVMVRLSKMDVDETVNNLQNIYFNSIS